MDLGTRLVPPCGGGHDADPMLVESLLSQVVQSEPGAWATPDVDLRTPELAPHRSALHRAHRFVGPQFDSSPSVRAGDAGPRSCDEPAECHMLGRADPDNRSDFDVMLLQALATSANSADSSLTMGAPASVMGDAHAVFTSFADAPDEDVPANIADGMPVQEAIEAMVCAPMQTPILRGGPRTRRPRTPVTVASLRRSGRLANRPRVANSTRQAQNVLMKKRVSTSTSRPRTLRLNASSERRSLETSQKQNSRRSRSSSRLTSTRFPRGLKWLTARLLRLSL